MRANDIERTAGRPARSTEEDLARLDRLITGSVVLSVPETAVVGTVFTVVLRVGVEDLDAMLKALADEIPENTARPGGSGIRLTPRMRASLTGLGFDIVPQGGVTQPVSTTEPTTWQWQAKPTESGTLILLFTLSQVVIVEGQEVARNYPFRKTVQVDVKPFSYRDFLTAYWQWLTTIILLPLAKLGWDQFRKPGKTRTPARDGAAGRPRIRLRRPGRR